MTVINEPRVTFVILNWNQCEMTLDCLDSLSKLDYQNFDVIIVDNGSTDNSVERIQLAYPECTILGNQENLGYSEGNNVGIRHALKHHPEYIFLLNNDTYVDSKLLSELITVAEKNPSFGILGPTMFYADPPNMLWGGKNWIDWHRSNVIRENMGVCIDTKSLTSQSPQEVVYIDSCAILVRSSVFNDVGLLDNAFFINFDDIDFCLRAQKAGYKVVYVPYTMIWHRVSAAIGVGSPANTYYMTRNSLIFFAKHSPGSLKLFSIVRLFLNTMRTTLAWFIKKEYQIEVFKRKRKVNLLAIRDFVLGHKGKMGEDVQRVCYGR